MNPEVFKKLAKDIHKRVAKAYGKESNNDFNENRRSITPSNNCFANRNKDFNNFKNNYNDYDRSPPRKTFFNDSPKKDFPKRNNDNFNININRAESIRPPSPPRSIIRPPSPPRANIRPPSPPRAIIRPPSPPPPRITYNNESNRINLPQVQNILPPFVPQPRIIQNPNTIPIFQTIPLPFPSGPRTAPVNIYEAREAIPAPFPSEPQISPSITDVQLQPIYSTFPSESQMASNPVIIPNRTLPPPPPPTFDYSNINIPSQVPSQNNNSMNATQQTTFISYPTNSFHTIDLSPPVFSVKTIKVNPNPQPLTNQNNQIFDNNVMTMKNQINSLNAQISNLNNQLVGKENII